jgi:hypothetical protein
MDNIIVSVTVIIGIIYRSAHINIFLDRINISIMTIISILTVVTKAPFTRISLLLSSQSKIILIISSSLSSSLSKNLVIFILLTHDLVHCRIHNCYHYCGHKAIIFIIGRHIFFTFSDLSEHHILCILPLQISPVSNIKKIIIVSSLSLMASSQWSQNHKSNHYHSNQDSRQKTIIIIVSGSV